MREFDFINEYKKLLTPETVHFLTHIHEQNGKLDRFFSEKNKAADTMLEIAKIQSTEASNRIEGIITTADRLKAIMQEKTMPRNRSEKEIAGYRDVLNTVHENYEYILPRPGHILQLHRDLYKFSADATGGHYKTSDNIIIEENSDGSKSVRFTPIPAWQTAEAMTALCDNFNNALKNNNTDPLLLIPVFILDFLCIHPFNDGNGRMSRLLTLLLLYRSGYFIGKYISLEKLISDTKATYYEALSESSYGWHEGNNNYAPFVSYMLGIISAAYTEAENRAGILYEKGKHKPDKVRQTIKNNLGKITKSEIAEKCPDVSQVTIQRTLAELLKNGEIIKIGGGRYTSYVWNGDKEAD